MLRKSTQLAFTKAINGQDYSKSAAQSLPKNIRARLTQLSFFKPLRDRIQLITDEELKKSRITEVFEDTLASLNRLEFETELDN